MDIFYRRLAEEMKEYEGDLWVETVISGENQGKKRVIKADQADNPSGEGKECGKPLSGDIQEEKVFRERIGRMPRLVICGGGHVSIPIIRIGKMLGFTVTVLEDRPKFAENARAAGADHVICESFEKGLSDITGGMDSWFVIVTRGHRYDTQCLELILKKKSAYVGMMGSRRRVAIVKEQLEQSGVSRELLDSVHTPIGLRISAETPEEIAVSVMAEIIQIKNSGQRGNAWSKELQESLLSEENRKMVLATIISRKGSAPRGVGTKMLIREDGSTVDTIGGGCVESEIVQKALLMMRLGEPQFQICRADMTMDAAEDEGMVCGGTVEVMMETV